MGIVSVTEYSSSPKITVVPTDEPGNELGEGSLPATWIVKADRLNAVEKDDGTWIKGSRHSWLSRCV